MVLVLVLVMVLVLVLALALFSVLVSILMVVLVLVLALVLVCPPTVLETLKITGLFSKLIDPATAIFASPRTLPAEMVHTARILIRALVWELKRLWCMGFLMPM